MIENKMIEQIFSSDFAGGLAQNFMRMLDALNMFLSGEQNIKALSLVLMLVAFILFLLLIIIVLMRNVLYFFRSSNRQKGKVFVCDDESDDWQRNELEKELQKELELASAERKNIQLMKEEEEKLKAADMQEAKKQKNKEKTESDKDDYLKQKNTVELDWQKGKTVQQEQVVLDDRVLSYRQSCIKLNHLMGLIVDMLGRDVDDLKIAQTINYKNQGMNDENEILKAIEALKKFIELCVSGKFAELDGYSLLPNEEEALYHLANGDPSKALVLLESLMNAGIDRANALVSEEKRLWLYGVVSNYACCFGVLSEQSDIMLATSAYELAIELQSTNVTAWSYLGDVYRVAGSEERAVWAYQNVLNYADEELDAAQIANANKHLSENLYAKGESLQAAKLYNAAKQYYDSLGINRRLDKQELDVIAIIENNHQDNLPEMVSRLLGREYSV